MRNTSNRNKSRLDFAESIEGTALEIIQNETQRRNNF